MAESTACWMVFQGWSRSPTLLSDPEVLTYNSPGVEEAMRIEGPSRVSVNVGVGVSVGVNVNLGVGEGANSSSVGVGVDAGPGKGIFIWHADKIISITIESEKTRYFGDLNRFSTQSMTNRANSP